VLILCLLYIIINFFQFEKKKKTLIFLIQYKMTKSFKFYA